MAATEETVDFVVLENELRIAIANRTGCAFLLKFLFSEDVAPTPGLCINNKEFRPMRMLIEVVAQKMEVVVRDLLGGNSGAINAICSRIKSDFEFEDRDVSTTAGLCDVQRELVQEIFIDPVGFLTEKIAEIVQIYRDWPDDDVKTPFGKNPFGSADDVNMYRLQFVLTASEHYAVNLDDILIDGTAGSPETGVHAKFGLLNERDLTSRFTLQLVLDELAKFHVSRRILTKHIPRVNRQRDAAVWLNALLLAASLSVELLPHGYQRDIILTVDGHRFGIVVYESSEIKASFHRGLLANNENQFIEVFRKLGKDDKGNNEIKAVWIVNPNPNGQNVVTVEEELNNGVPSLRVGGGKLVPFTKLEKVASRISELAKVMNNVRDDNLRVLNVYNRPAYKPSEYDDQWASFADTFWSKTQVKKMFNVDAGNVYADRCTQLFSDGLEEVAQPNNWIGSWRVRHELGQSILYDSVMEGKGFPLFGSDNVESRSTALKHASVSKWLAIRSSIIRGALEMPAAVFDADLPYRTPNMDDSRGTVQTQTNLVNTEKHSRTELLRFIAKLGNTCDDRIEWKWAGVPKSLVAGSVHQGVISPAIDNLVLVWEFVISNTMVSPRFPLGNAFRLEDASAMDSVVEAVKEVMQITGGEPSRTATSTTLSDLDSHKTVKVDITFLEEKVVASSNLSTVPPLPTVASSVGMMTRVRVVCSLYARLRNLNHTHELEKLRVMANRLTTSRGSGLFIRPTDAVSKASGGGATQQQYTSNRQHSEEQRQNVDREVQKTFRKRMLFAVVSIDAPFFAQGETRRRFLPSVFFGSRLLSTKDHVTEKQLLNLSNDKVVVTNKDLFELEANNHINGLRGIQNEINHIEALGGMTAKFTDSADWFSLYDHAVAPVEHRNEWTHEDIDGKLVDNITIPRGKPVPLVRNALGGSIAEASQAWAFLCGVLDFLDNQPNIQTRLTINNEEWKRATRAIYQTIPERRSGNVFGVDVAQNDIPSLLCNMTPIKALGWDGPMIRAYCGVFVSAFIHPKDWGKTYNDHLSKWDSEYEGLSANREITLRSIGHHLERPRILNIDQSEKEKFFAGFEEKWKVTNRQLRSHVRGVMNKAKDSTDSRPVYLSNDNKKAPTPMIRRDTSAEGHLKRWLVDVDGNRKPGWQEKQWVRVRNSISEAAALDDDDSINGPLPIDSNSLVGKLLSAACEFYYAMLQTMTTLRLVNRALSYVDHDNETRHNTGSGRSYEERFVKFERCVNRTRAIFDCINAGKYQDPSQDRTLYKRNTELFGVGEYDKLGTGHLRVTNESSTDLLQTPLDAEVCTLNVARVVAAMRYPAEFAAHYRSKAAFQHDVESVLNWFFEWIAASNDKGNNNTPKIDEEFLTDKKRPKEEFDRPDRPSWQQLVQTSRAVANLVGADTAMFNILDAMDDDHIGDQNQRFRHAKKVADQIFKPYQTNTFTEQAIGKFAPVFEDFAVNGTMHSLETAAYSGVTGDQHTDVTRRGAQEWIKCQRERIYSVLKVAAPVYKGSDCAVETYLVRTPWSEAKAGYEERIRRDQNKNQFTDDEYDQRLRSAEKKYEADQNAAIEERFNEIENCNKRALETALSSLRDVIRQNPGGVGGFDDWTIDRDQKWKNILLETISRSHQGKWMDKFTAMQTRIDEFDARVGGIKNPEQAEARDKLLIEHIKRQYKPAPVSAEDDVGVPTPVPITNPAVEQGRTLTEAEVAELAWEGMDRGEAM